MNLLGCLARTLILGSLLFPAHVLAHGDEPHDDAAKPTEALAGNPEATSPGRTLDDIVGSFLDLSSLREDLSFAEFPTLHPLIVHVPVTFIPLALVFALIAAFSAQRVFVWLALGFSVSGLLGGLVAAFPMHPHTIGLPDAARATLEKHDFFAYATLWITFVAVLIALVSIWKPVRMIRIVLGVVLLVSSVTVAITGHYGGTLAYVHGVGVKGQFLSDH
jgi:uncharacterized membrane protein